MPLPTTPSIIAKDPKDHIMLFYGMPGVGKSWFVNELGQKVLFLSTDRGTRTMKAYRVECTKWEHFLFAVQELEKKEVQYDIVCVDHIDDAASMCEAYILKKLDADSLSDKKLPFGKGWKAYRAEMEGFMRRILALRVGLVFIAHDETKTLKQGGIEFDQTMPAIGKSAWRVIVPTADLIGYCKMKSVKDEKTNERKEIRILETMPRQDMYLKDRTRRQKPQGGGYEPLDAKKFIATFANYK
jgi:hypothetical protein